MSRLFVTMVFFLAVVASARAQTVVFNDTFGNGSTINSNPTNPTVPLTDKAAYQQLAAKTFSPNPPTITAGNMRYGIVNTSSGFNHIQALFTQYPVTLANVGDYIEMTVVFTNQASLMNAANASLFFGMYDTGAVQPIPGGMNSTVSTATPGYAQNWQGYVSRILYSGGTHSISTRPAQTVAAANNQDTLYNFSGGTIFGIATTPVVAAFTTGAQYCEVLRFTKASATSITVTSTLYEGANASGTQIFTETASSSSILTATFDGLSIGYRAVSGASVMSVNAITIATNAAITIQPVISTHPVSQTKTVGEQLNLSVVADGGGTPLNYQWYKDNAAILGATASTYTIPAVITTDAGTYKVTVSNAAGSATSTDAVITVTTDPTAPSINTHPADAAVVAGGSHTFSVSASGSAVLTYQWQKSTDGGATYPTNVGSSSTSPSLTISNAALSDAGMYRAVVTNMEGSATSNGATLAVHQAPAITAQPAGSIIAPGVDYTLSVTATGTPAPSYQWQRTIDGAAFANVAGGTGADLVLTGGAATNGYYKVTVTNAAGSVTSSVAYVGVASTQSVTFAPGNHAANISVDQQLRLVFPDAPKLGLSGTLTIRDAADDSVVAAIDRSQFISYAPGNTFAVIPNAAIRNVQGTFGGSGNGSADYYYMPIAMYGNEVWVTLSPTQRLAYGRTYYVNMDAGLLLDSTNAAFAGISGSTIWRFSTKASGPATPTASTGPATVTVGQDGAGDFATFQGAFDWIPQNNTLPRTVRVKPGIYRDSATLAQNRNFVTIVGDGASRTDVQLIYPFAFFAPPIVFPSGSLRIESSDVSVRDLTLDNIIYLDYHPTGHASSGAPGPFAGAINTLATTGKRIVFDNVLIKGGQDTIYHITGTDYFYNCEIWGSVDFLYGKALAVFDRCNIVQIRNVGGPVGAPNTDYDQPHGQVFLNCTFPRALVANGYPYDVGVGTTTYMRPWRQDGATAIINCSVGTQMSTPRWMVWDGRETTCRAREYGTTLIGGGALAPGTAYWNNTTDPDYVSSTMAPTNPLLAPPDGPANRTPVTVNPADYTLAAIFGHTYYNLNGWMPALAARITTQPTSQTIEVGQSVTFTVTATGEPAPAYQWHKDGNSIGGATSSSYIIPSATTSDAGTYTVVAANSAGSTASNGAVLTVQSILDSWKVANFGSASNPNAADNADPDSDGIINAMEFAFGLNPNASDSGPLMWNGTALISHGMPVSGVESTPTGVNHHAVFIRRLDWNVAGLTYTVRFSRDLITWEDSAAIPAVIASGATHEAVGVPYPHLINQASAGFFRVVITSP